MVVTVLLANFFGSQFLYLIYNRSSFDGLDESELTGILNIISINIFFMISIALLLKIYISNNLTSIILKATILNVIVNTLANYLVITKYGVLGIAISTLISTYLLNWILLSYYFKLNLFKNFILALLLITILIFIFLTFFSLE